MRPLALKGHDRALTRVRFNRDGDLLFSASKNKFPCVWYTENGERIGTQVEKNFSFKGTYDGHNGAVWDLDVSWDTKHIATAAADNYVRFWDTETGKTLHSISTATPARSISISFSGNIFAFTTMKMTKNMATLCLVDIRDPQQFTSPEHLLFNAGLDHPAATSLFSSLDDKITIGSETGLVSQYDMRNPELPCSENASYAINDLQLSPCGLFIIAASRDKTASLLDVNTLETLKVYKSERPVNSACVSPIRDHVCLGGGEDAMQVTQTAVSAGHFEAKLYHLVFEEEFARFKGHFGPINTMAFHPNGTIIATGGEDGYIRLQEFDDDYLEFKYDY